MPKQQGLKPIGHSIKIIIDKIKAEREAKRNKNKPIRTQPKIPGLAQGGLKQSYRGDDPMKKRRKGLSPQQPALPSKPKSPGRDQDRKKGAGPYGEKPPQLKKSKKERREEFRKKARKSGSTVVFADEWEHIDPGLQKGLFKKDGGRIGLKKGGSDKNWIQKAVNPKHKGFCTPMTKKTCTPRRKALARTFKKMGRERKAKG